MKSLHRSLAAGLALVALILTAAPALAQGMGTPSPSWMIGTQDLKFRRTLASTATTPFSGNGAGYTSGSIFTNTGAVAGSFRDSTYIIRANTAGQMQFDTTTAFSLANLEDWTPKQPGIAAVTATDSVWAWSLQFYPVNDGWTTALAASSTGGGATITADSLQYYMELSFDGGQTWQRTISLVAFILENGTSNSFHLAFNSLTPASESGTIGPANFLQYNALYRYVFVHDCAGRYGVRLLYPRAIR
jgi:hypothetical protein